MRERCIIGVGARRDSARAQRRLRGVSGVGHGARYGGVASSVLKGGSRALFDSRASSCLRVQQRERTKKSTPRRQRGGASWWMKWRLRWKVLASSWGRRVVLREIEVVMCVFVTTCSLLSTWWQHAVEHKGECLRAVSEELSLIKCKVYWSKGRTSSWITLRKSQEAKEYLLTLLMISRGFGLNRDLGAVPVCCVGQLLIGMKVDNAGHLSSAINLC